MARPKRQGEWVPVTVRMDRDAAKRLRVAAARRDLTMGALMDQLVLSNLPPVDPEPALLRKPQPKVALSISRLEDELLKLGSNQSQLARMLGISPKAVNEWFQRGRIPAARQEAVRQALGRIQAGKARP